MTERITVKIGKLAYDDAWSWEPQYGEMDEREQGAVYIVTGHREDVADLCDWMAYTGWCTDEGVDPATRAAVKRAHESMAKQIKALTGETIVNRYK